MQPESFSVYLHVCTSPEFPTRLVDYLNLETIAPNCFLRKCHDAIGFLWSLIMKVSSGLGLYERTKSL